MTVVLQMLQFVCNVEKKRSMGIVIRQSIKGTVINYIGAFIGFLTTFFIQTRFLSAEEIGLLSVIYEAGMFVTALAMLGTNSSAVRFFPFFKGKGKNNNGFFFYLLLFPFIGCIVFIPLYIILHTPVSNYFSKNSALFIDYYNWIIPLILFLTYWLIFETYAQLQLRIAIPKFIREIGLRVFLLVLYLLYGFNILDLNGLVLGYIGVYGLCAIWCFWYISKIGTVSLRHNSTDIDKPLRWQVAKYTAYLIIGAIGGTIVGRLDLFMVSAQLGLDYAGVYRIAFYIVAIIGIPTQSISTIAGPVASEMLSKENFAGANILYQKVALHQFVAGSLIFLFIWINIDNIFSIIPNGEVYKAGKWVVFFMSLAKLVEVTLIFGGTLVSYSKYYYWGLYFTFFITAITIVSNNLLIPIWGMVGAAIATMLTTLLTYGVQQLLIFWKIKGNPYTFALLKQVGILAVLYGINCLLPTVTNPWFDCIYRSIILGGLALILLYIFRVSEEMNDLIKSVLRIK